MYKLNPSQAQRDRGKKGAAHELLVSYDLILKGYDVYRAVSHNAVCDLIAIKDGRVLRVEVTTAYNYVRKDGTKCKGYNKHDTARYDVLAVVNEGSIEYYGLM